MRIREENCNMVLLAVVTLFTVAIAGGASLVGPTEKKAAYLADRSAVRAQQAPSPDKQIIYVSNQSSVRRSFPTPIRANADIHQPASPDAA
jgi:hypothetical protein